MDDYMKNCIIKDYESGKSISDLAHMYGKSTTRIHTIIKEAGVSRDRQEATQMATGALDGNRLVEIAKQYKNEFGGKLIPAGELARRAGIQSIVRTYYDHYPELDKLVLKEASSPWEEKVSRWLDDHNIPYKRRDRGVLGNKELDFLLLDRYVAIEVDDTWTHQVTKPVFGKLKTWDEHLDKTMLCREKGFHLIHLFEPDFQDLSKKLGQLIQPEIYTGDIIELDMSYQDPTLSLTNGYVFIERTEPMYWWVRKDSLMWLKKEDAQKEIRRNFGAEGLKQEKEIMKKQGYLQIFNCGTEIFQRISDKPGEKS